MYVCVCASVSGPPLSPLLLIHPFSIATKPTSRLPKQLDFLIPTTAVNSPFPYSISFIEPNLDFHPLYPIHWNIAKMDKPYKY